MLSWEETRMWWFPGALDFRARGVSFMCFAERKERTAITQCGSARKCIHTYIYTHERDSFNIHDLAAYTSVRKYEYQIVDIIFSWIAQTPDIARALQVRMKERNTQREREKLRTDVSRKRQKQRVLQNTTVIFALIAAGVAKRRAATDARLARQEKSRNVNSLSRR